MTSRFRSAIPFLALAAIGAHVALVVRSTSAVGPWGIRTADWPLLLALASGGIVLVYELALQALRREFSSDLLAGISIVTGVLLHEYLAAVLVVLMLSGGQALEAYAVRSASSVLKALAKRMPTRAHRKVDGGTADMALEDVGVGDHLVVLPHEICPVDGTVLDGRGTMDESYLTGEPYVMSKAPGAAVMSGAINGESALVIRADRRPVDSRYAKIMEVMRDSEQRRPAMRRLGDELGAYYTPLAVALAVLAWLISGDVTRFLAVLVVATPCPLLIAIPVAIIGAVSLSARRGIIIKDPSVLERIETCRIALFDKTGTLTYGQPVLVEVRPMPGFSREQVLTMAASLEQYSRHPLAVAVLETATKEGLPRHEVSEVSERPGEGLRGSIGDQRLEITSRAHVASSGRAIAGLDTPAADGMECLVLVDGALAAICQFRDEPRTDGISFIAHLARKHGMTRVALVSGDRDGEVRYLAERVGITEIHASQTPEQKLALVRAATSTAPTLFVGDGINDAPALTAATVGVAFGQGSDITSEAAGAVILETSLRRVDELLHIGRRLRVIALQSAVGGMALSVLGMGLAAMGWLPPVAGAIAQEAIDVFAVVNALRAAWPPRVLTDY